MAKDIPTLLGSRIKAVRKKRGMSQEQLAEKLDTTRGYISRVERGSVNIGVDRLMEFCTSLDVTAMDLLSEKDIADGIDVHEALQNLLNKGTERDLKLIYKISRAIIS